MKFRCIFFSFLMILLTASSLYSQTTDAGIPQILSLNPYVGNQAVKVSLENFGTNTLTYVTIDWMVDATAQTAYNWSGSLATDSIASPVNIGSYNFTAGPHTVKVYVTLPNGVADSNNANDTATVTVTFTTPAYLPYCESFETGFGQWQQMTDDNYDWTRTNVATPTTSTGPDAAYDGSYFIYTEADGQTAGWSANLELPVDFTGITHPTISFYYHMYGTQMGSLHLDVYDNSWHTDVWTQTGNLGNTWFNQVVDLSTYANYGVVLLRWRGIRGSGTRSDMALDKICVYQVYNSDLEVTAILQPTSPICSTTSNNVDVIVKNNGYNSQTNIPVGVNVVLPDNSTVSLHDTITTSLAAGAADTVIVGQVNLSLIGTYVFHAFTSFTGDQNTANDTVSASVIVKGNVSTFPFVENFESGNNYFTLTGSTLGSATVVLDAGNNVIDFTGGTAGTGWTGSGTGTTATNAWTQNTTHQARAYTCVVNATSLTDVRLTLDLKQISPVNYYMNNWFRVLVNDTVQITDINGVSNFNPPLATYTTKTFGLTAYAGTQFKLTFETAERYNSSYVGTGYTVGTGDNAWVDNVHIFQPVNNDAGVAAITAPSGSVCSNSATDVVVTVKNFGSNTLDSIPVHAVVTNPSGVITTLTGFYYPNLTTLTSGSVTLSSVIATVPGTYQVKAYTSLTGDPNAANDTISSTFIVMADITTFPFLENFESSNNYFTLAAGTNASANIVSEVSGNHAVNFTGATANTGWTGTATTTTATNAWVDNATHHGTVFTCIVDATSLTYPVLQFDLKQTGTTSLYNWVRVLANDTVQLTDVTGVTNYNTPLANYTNKKFDLSAYAGTHFKLSIQACERYNAANTQGETGGDNAFVDNINIYQPFMNDAGVSQILSPVTGCPNAANSVSVIVTNFGANSLSNIPASVTITDPAGNPTTLTGSLAGPLASGASDTLDLPTYSSLLPGSYTVNATTTLTGDPQSSNNSITSTFTIYHSITTFPYYDNLESGNLYFTLTGTTYATATYALDGTTNHALYFTGGNLNTGWTGNGTGTTAAQAWTTNTTHQAFAYTCSIDATSASALNLSFDLKQASPANYYLYNWFRVLINDTVQISDNTGVSNFNPNGTNVYSNKIFNLNAYAGTQFKLTFEAAVKYNSTYSPTAYPGGDNVYVDNINMYVPPPVDMEAVTIGNLPVSSCDLGVQNISMTIKNLGTTTVLTGTVLPVAYSVNGGTSVNENITLTSDLAYDSTMNYTFTQGADLSADGNYTVHAWVSIPGDGNLNNDTAQATTVNLVSIGTYPYVQDFETNSDGWSSEMIAVANSWVLGTPAKTYITSAHSGTKAWVTGLTQNYTANEQSVLLTPCFDFTNLINPNISFWLNLHSENLYDGAILESTTDEGLTWVKVGATTTGFYTNPVDSNASTLVTPPWWSGNNNGWNHYSVVDSSLAGQSSVRFRFLFIADNSVQDNGLAIDDFSIYDIMVAEAGNNLQICPGSTAQLGVSVSGGVGPFTYHWTPGVTLSDSLISNPVATPAVNTTYYVTVTDSNGTSSTDTVSVTITNNPTIDLGNDFNICQGDQVPLGAPAGVSYNWSNGATTQTIMISQAGAYWVTVDEGAGCIGISNTVNVGVDPIPVVNLGNDVNANPGDIVTLDAGNPGALFLWSTDATTQTIDVTSPGTYSVTVTVNNCSASDVIVVTFLGITDITNGISVLISPNPNNGYFTLEINNFKTNVVYDLYSPEGKRIFRKYSADKQVTDHLDFTTLPKGMYYINITDGQKVVTKKILIQ
ncbi:MAG: T9SS type A sorting domain-containing protein [Bacteroidia bacterium]|nr:T9SS type A sorting domain-containing protein [Bacteroidia bacterium]